MELDKAYKKLQGLKEQVKKLADEVKPQFSGTINPFERVFHSLNSDIRELRKELIEQAARECQFKYMPNAKPEIDFLKLMDEKVGEDGFREAVIEEYFKGVAGDSENLKVKSLMALKDLTSRFVPYGYHTEKGKEEWGPPKSFKELVKGRVLKLRAYTWDSSKYGGLRTSAHDQLDALEKLIAIATAHANPIDVEGDTIGIRRHVSSQHDPSEFYKKIVVNHKAVKSFRFFKNNTLQIEFKSEKLAKKVAKLLL